MARGGWNVLNCGIHLSGVLDRQGGGCISDCLSYTGWGSGGQIDKTGRLVFAGGISKDRSCRHSVRHPPSCGGSDWKEETPQGMAVKHLTSQRGF